MAIDYYGVAVNLLGGVQPGDEQLAQMLEKLALLGASEEERRQVRRAIEANIGITMEAGSVLANRVQEPWLDDARAKLSWVYWNAYARYLADSGFSQPVIRVLGEDIDNILGECGNPRAEGPWAIKGLVMGDVQSGKTASYSGLVCKAADAGYRFIVLLTGMIEDLRAQSQERLDAGFVGKDSRSFFDTTKDKRRIGAGAYRDNTPAALTSVDSDFLTSNAKVLQGIPLRNFISQEPVLLVMKKNKSALENLCGFLDSQLHGGARHDIPLLVIDDEADNASVNVRSADNPATINALIRQVLDRFTRSSYVAYTATPFANVFIDPDIGDLFPSNFVYALETPSNYIGVDGVFGEEGAHAGQLVDVADAEAHFPAKHKKTHPVPEIPPSLEEAMRVFLISSAVRDLRGEKLRHRSMLVNVTRFTDVQERVASVLKDLLGTLQEEIRQYMSDDETWSRHPLLAQLHEDWNRHFADCGEHWDDVRKTLHSAASPVKVLTINQKSEREERLNYSRYKTTEMGRRVIAVGGLTLSRGLTLEGLSVSYFYRHSRAYDTLLQMGRWFGYRTGYADLCRVFMDPEAQGWFSHIAQVVTELRNDILRMSAREQPPSDFGMRVRSHPSTLIVTALNKMRNSEDAVVPVSFSRRLISTPHLPSDVATNERNIQTVAVQVARLPGWEEVRGRHLVRGVHRDVISSLLASLEIVPRNLEFAPGMNGELSPLIEFISSTSEPRLQNWDIAIPDGNAEQEVQAISIPAAGGTRHPKPRQRQFERARGSRWLKLNKLRVGDISDDYFDLTEAQINAVREAWENSKRNARKGKTAPGDAYVDYRDRPLLTLHVIEPISPEGGKNRERKMEKQDIKPEKLLAVSIRFPEFGDGGASSCVKYRLNKVALRGMGLLGEEADDEDDDED